MKWPSELVVVRHGESVYNALKAQKANTSLYREFRARCEEVTDWTAPLPLELAKLARKVQKEFTLGISDYKTPLNDEGVEQAKVTAEKLARITNVPDIVFVSPYMRTMQTWEHMKERWQELESAKFYEEERIREREHGLLIPYNDWWLMTIFHPEQKVFYDSLKEYAEYSYTYPQGENVPMVRDRIRSWISTLIREFAGMRVLAITHHVTILALRANLERLSAEEFIRLDKEEKPVNCGVTIYRGDPNQGEDGRLILTHYNQKLY